MKLFHVVLVLAIAVLARAGDLDTMGVTVLRQVDSTLQGSGVIVAQPEGQVSANAFEVNPLAVGQPTNLFTYISTNGTPATGFPNSAGLESGHAGEVAGSFYGITNGVAPQLSHVYNYEADYFFNHIISPQSNISARVVNQSFIFSTSEEATVNPAYDNYAAKFGTLFVSGIGNGGGTPVSPAGTSYNGIGVGIYGACPTCSSTGPTDDGRSKPDITAPDQKDIPFGGTSYTAPYVAGSAAILVQAATRGDGGTNLYAATNLCTIKALLLNGAIKPGDWTNGVISPLDARYGAGIVNVFNSWKQLTGGKHSYIQYTTNSSGGAHPPGTNPTNEPVLVGWDLNSITTRTNQDKVNHYYFNLPASNYFTLTATLVWNKQYAATAINDLNLFLYNTGNSNLVACSTSLVDNVEHLFLPQLAPGRYDLQVLKRGSASQVSTNETYALAFEIFNVNLSIAHTNNNNIAISWPVYPTGFNLKSTASLNPPISWAAVNSPVSVNTNNSQNVVTQSVGSANQFFRLQRP